MIRKKTLRDIDVKGKKVLVRVDYNVPLDSKGEVADDTRIRATLPTLRYLISQEAKTILISHLGRPKGKIDPAVKLDPIARALSSLLGQEVKKVDKTVTEEVKEVVNNLKGGEVLLLENVRFNPGEATNDPNFARQLADLADIYVNDAFGTAHRAHASTVGVTAFLPSVAGFLLEEELRNLSQLLEAPAAPFCAVLGGNKVSDKIGVIKNFLGLVDCLILGGGMCFTFLKAGGFSIGDSIIQEDFLKEAEFLIEKASKDKCRILLPDDVVIAKEISSEAEFKVVEVKDGIPNGWRGLDIGPRTAEKYSEIIRNAKTVFWNGPMGVFEIEAFSNGTRQICQALAANQGVTIVGGGDSDAALRRFASKDQVTFVSTGGGACLKFLEGTPLPGVEALDNKE